MGYYSRMFYNSTARVIIQEMPQSMLSSAVFFRCSTVFNLSWCAGHTDRATLELVDAISADYDMEI